MLLGGSLFRVTAIDKARPAERKPGGTNPDLLVSITQFSVNQMFCFVFPVIIILLTFNPILAKPSETLSRALSRYRNLRHCQSLGCRNVHNEIPKCLAWF